jgi:hypothetical protein
VAEHSDVEAVTSCPRCFARAKEPCVDLRRRGKVPIEQPHEERLKRYFDIGPGGDMTDGG